MPLLVYAKGSEAHYSKVKAGLMRLVLNDWAGEEEGEGQNGGRWTEPEKTIF